MNEKQSGHWEQITKVDENYCVISVEFVWVED